MILKNKFLTSLLLFFQSRSRSFRITLYIVSLLLFVILTFTVTTLNIFRSITLTDIHNFYIKGQYLKVILSAEKIKVRNLVEKNKLDVFVTNSNINLYKMTGDAKFLYAATDRILTIQSFLLHIKMLKNILHSLKDDGEKRAGLLYYYVKNKKSVSNKLTRILLQYFEDDKRYINSLYLLMDKVKFKHKILFKLAKIYALEGEYERALKYLRIAKKITKNSQFIRKANDFILLLLVRMKECKNVLALLSKVNFYISERRHQVYKYLCQDILNVLQIKEIREFLQREKINESDKDLFLLSLYFAIKVLLEDKYYTEVIKKIEYILNIPNYPESLISKEDIISHVLQKRIPHYYKRAILTILIRHSDSLNTSFLLDLFRNYIIPRANIFGYTTRRKIYSKIIDIIKKKEKEYSGNLESLLKMYYILTKSYYATGNYRETVVYGSSYVKIKPLLDFEKIEVFKLVINSLYKQGNYKGAVEMAEEVLSGYEGIHKVKIEFMKLKLQSLKKIDKVSFFKNVEKILKESNINFDNPYYKYFFKQYIYGLLERAQNIKYTKGMLSWIDKVIMYHGIYKELYNEELKDIDIKLVKIIGTRSTLNNCSLLIYYYKTFVFLIPVLFQNQLSEKLYKFVYCMLKKNKTVVIIPVLQEVQNLKNLSNLDRFMVSAFLYLAYKKENASLDITKNLLKLSRKIYRLLDEVSLNAFPNMPYSPKKIGAVIYGK